MHDHLLDSRQVAQFVADGILRFDALVPDEINRATLDELADDGLCRYACSHRGMPLSGHLAESAGVGRMLRLPQVRGIIASLVGSDPTFDHHCFHSVGPGAIEGHSWHADAIIDPRPAAFDIQLFYFPHDTPREMGGTMFVPGSHFRRVHEFHIARYQNFVGQMPAVCPAGTVFVAHHGIWHTGQPNRTERMRTMFKIRLNPTRRQRLLWDTSDLDHPDIHTTLGRDHGWYSRDHRLEIVNRIKLWRHLIGDPAWDSDMWLTRVENEPEEAGV